MHVYLILVLAFLFLILLEMRDHKKMIQCKWCGCKHFGRCIWNPRSGKVFSNCNDGHFDWNDPNK